MIEKNDIITLSKYLSIISHGKNRIRLRVSLDIKNETKELDISFIEELPDKIDGINKIKINKLIGSITINYDNAIFKPALWDELVSGDISEELWQKFRKILKEN